MAGVVLQDDAPTRGSEQVELKADMADGTRTKIDFFGTPIREKKQRGAARWFQSYGVVRPRAAASLD
jgi:hypothetical protein